MHDMIKYEGVKHRGAFLHVTYSEIPRRTGVALIYVSIKQRLSKRVPYLLVNNQYICTADVHCDSRHGDVWINIHRLLCYHWQSVPLMIAIYWITPRAPHWMLAKQLYTFSQSRRSLSPFK